MESRSTMMKVLSPVEGKNGKTFWMRIGNAFINRDGSTNVYLNAYPTTGKLQIRALDDRDKPRRSDDSEAGYSGNGASYGAGGAADSDGLPF